MKIVKNGLIAAMFALAAAAPASALTTSEVLDAMNTRVGEISQEMTIVRSQISSAGSAAERSALIRELRMLNVRRAQLISLSRIVPRYSEVYLERIVTYFDLDVSPA